MKLGNIFRKKKKPKDYHPPSVLQPKPAHHKKEIKEIKEIKEKTIPPKERKEILGEAWKILKAPHVTEKATDLTKKNQYIFKVWGTSNKTEIKKAIENLYGIDVVSVRIINVPRKQRKLGKISGWRTGYKKAIVKIKEGQKIEVLPR